MRLVCKSDRFLQKKFQSTHPRGVRRHENGSSISLYLFQSTHPHGVRHELGSIERFLKSFNPRTHMGCDAHRFLRARLWRCFNPRTHMGCDLSVIGYTRSRKSFNPRTHMGCDAEVAGQDGPHRVSIHAPTWGATQMMMRLIRQRLFQSTHPHGVRPGLRRCRSAPSTCFNPRTHMGCDVDVPSTKCDSLFQSTHPHGVRLIFSKYLNIILQKYINCEQHANF